MNARLMLQELLSLQADLLEISSTTRREAARPGMPQSVDAKQRTAALLEGIETVQRAIDARAESLRRRIIDIRNGITPDFVDNTPDMPPRQPKQTDNPAEEGDPE